MVCDVGNYKDNWLEGKIAIGELKSDVRTRGEEIQLAWIYNWIYTGEALNPRKKLVNSRFGDSI